MNRHPVDSLLLQCNYPIDSRQRIRTDIIAIISKIPTLNPRIIKVNEQNQPTNVIVLEGTIPIQYKGINYNIFINCILRVNYPHVAPVIYVVPLEKMVIKAGTYVDEDGSAKHPFLRNWNMRSSSLGEILTELSRVFSVECPVFKQSEKKLQSQYQNTPADAPKPQNLVAINSVGECNDKLIDIFRTISIDTSRESQEINKKKEELLQHKNELLELKQKAIESIIKIKAGLKKLDDEEIRLKSIPQNSNEWDCLSELMPGNIIHKQILFLVSEEQAYEQSIMLLKKLFNNKKISAVIFVRNMKDMSNKYFLVSRLREKALKAVGGI